MANDERMPVAVSRRIDASAHDIFQLLADPGRHPEFDGSGMVREGASNTVVSGVGDVFVMKMRYAALGDYEMNNLVVEYEVNRRIGWEPAPGDGHPDADAQDSVGNREGHRWIFELTPAGPNATVVTEIYDCSHASEQLRLDVSDGRAWVESMTKTLERLDRLCVTRSGGTEGAPASR
jgi:uncharacterized protein YndB with AHSA1/START domain